MIVGDQEPDKEGDCVIGRSGNLGQRRGTAAKSRTCVRGEDWNWDS